MPPPRVRPIGQQLTGTAKVVGRAFADALAAVDGAPHTWMILLTLTTRVVANQRELATAVGIEGPPSPTISTRWNATACCCGAGTPPTGGCTSWS